MSDLRISNLSKCLKIPLLARSHDIHVLLALRPFPLLNEEYPRLIQNINQQLASPSVNQVFIKHRNTVLRLPRHFLLYSRPSINVEALTKRNLK